MVNHIHVVWQALGEFTPKEIQLSFMKFTSQMILKDLRNNHTQVLEKFLVNAPDRKCQVWERRPLAVSLWNQKVLKQKIDYIHNNPVAAGLCNFPYEYHYSSASFYKIIAGNFFRTTFMIEFYWLVKNTNQGGKDFNVRYIRSCKKCCLGFLIH